MNIDSVLISNLLYSILSALSALIVHLVLMIPMISYLDSNMINSKAPFLRLLKRREPYVFLRINILLYTFDHYYCSTKATLGKHTTLVRHYKPYGNILFCKYSLFLYFKSSILRKLSITLFTYTYPDNCII